MVPVGALGRDGRLSFGLLHVRDGSNDNTDPLNEEVRPSRDTAPRVVLGLPAIDSNLLFVVESRPKLGFEYKMFVDFSDIDFRCVKKLLAEEKFKDISMGRGERNRAWFIIPGCPTKKTTDGLLNNFYYPS